MRKALLYAARARTMCPRCALLPVRFAYVAWLRTMARSSTFTHDEYGTVWYSMVPYSTPHTARIRRNLWLRAMAPSTLTHD